eukprot:SAG31_NODE_2117_length_6412_cov_7.762712_1_plen_65_part_00
MITPVTAVRLDRSGRLFHHQRRRCLPVEAWEMRVHAALCASLYATLGIVSALDNGLGKLPCVHA